MAQNTSSQQSKPSLLEIVVNLFTCIILPVLVLKKMSPENMLGSQWALVLALSFPLIMGIYDFCKKKKITFIPALGFISTLLTGGIGLLQLPVQYLAIKEAAIPFAIAVAVLLSTKTRNPLIKTFLYNDIILNTDKISFHLKAKKKEQEFETVLKKATYLLACTFFLSAALNYVLAKWLVVSPSGTAEFNDELGTMTLLSYPVIALPSTIITIWCFVYVIKQSSRLTELSLEELLPDK